MKLLQSGIEMTPEELRHLNGGQTCACGCEGTVNSENMWTSSRDGGGCACGCSSQMPGIPSTIIVTVKGSPHSSATFYVE